MAKLKNGKKTLRLTGDIKIARSRDALNQCSVAEIESIRRECYHYLATSESYVRRKICE